eukprot:1886111-Amphidinium_carterae.1
MAHYRTTDVTCNHLRIKQGLFWELKPGHEDEGAFLLQIISLSSRTCLRAPALTSAVPGLVLSVNILMILHLRSDATLAG